MPVPSVCLLSNLLSSITQATSHHLVVSLGRSALFDTLAESPLIERMYRSQPEERWRYQENITRDRDTLLVSAVWAIASSPEDSHGWGNPSHRAL